MPFSINQIEPDNRPVIFCLFVFCLSFLPSKANRQVQLPEVPYEVIFADVRFQFSESSRAVFQREIDRVVAGERVNSDVRLLRLFLPVTAPLLTARNLPQDFNYLLLYNRYQTNVSNTILFEPGVFWCLTKEQARDADLLVNEEIDERKHVTRSTEGAAVALLRSNVLYNNWGTTLFAQLVAKNVLNAIGVNTEWKGKEFLLIDSPAYGSLIHFLAYKWVMEHSIKQYNSETPELVYLYPYGKGKRLGMIAAELRITESELVEQNRWLASGSKINSEDQPVVLIIPANKKEEIMALAELAANTELPEKELGFPVVVSDQSSEKGRGGSFYRINERKGIRADFCDSPITLAYKADLSLKTFLEINEIAENEQVSPGQIYYLEEKSGKGPIPYHVARQGENLWTVSMNYGVKMAELLKFNRMEENQPLERGRLVWLQEKRPKNEDVEYREIKARTYPDSLLDHALMVSVSPFEWIEPKSVAGQKNVLPDSTLKSLASETTMAVSVETGKSELVTESFKKEIEVRPVEKKSYTEQLKESVSEKKDFVFHEVKKGETLYRISVNYKVPLNQLYELNGLSSNIIEIGDQIKVKRY